MQVPRAPAAHVEPLHCARGTRAFLPMQQNQLLQGTHGSVLQHLLQLWKTETSGGRGFLFYPRLAKLSSLTEQHCESGHGLIQAQKGKGRDPEGRMGGAYYYT